MRWHKRWALGMLLLAGGACQAAEYCGDFKGHYGPLDYRMRGQVNLEVVENRHFPQEVEQGLHGSSGELGQDLDYTLRAIPNHHRALVTLTRLALRQKAVKIAHMKFPVECYFERAQRYTPDDGKVHALYGNYLMAVGREADARRAYNLALELEPENATIAYNLGLLTLKAGQYEQAVAFAEKAYGLDFPLPYLKNKLQAAGKWTASNDAAVAAVREAAASAAETKSE